MSVKTRVQELNTRLAEKLTAKGVEADGSETTTSLINKVDNIVNEIPDGYIKPDGTLEIDKNGIFDVTEKAEVNVQVVAKPEKPYVDSSKMKYFAYMFANKNADLSIVKNLDTSNGTNFSSMFEGNTDLTEPPELDTSNGMDFSRMFQRCSNLTGEIGLDTSNGTNFAGMFGSCTRIKKITRLDTSKATNLNGFVGNTVDLESIPLIDTANCTNLGEAFMQNFGKLEIISLTTTAKNTNWNYTFAKCPLLHTIEGILTFKDNAILNGVFYNCNSLQNVTFDYIGINNNQLSFANSSNLTVDSLLSILDALSDNTGLDTTYTVHLGSANIAKLTDEQLAIAYDKNINLD